MKKIAVIGTGYVGLVTGTCFAETGNQVTCIDIDAQKVERMLNGEIPIYEPQLDTLFERNLKAGRLKITTDLKDGIQDAEIVFLALPTPPGEDGSADLSYILGVAEHIGKIIEDYKVIIQTIDDHIIECKYISHPNKKAFMRKYNIKKVDYMYLFEESINFEVEEELEEDCG